MRKLYFFDCSVIILNWYHDDAGIFVSAFYKLLMCLENKLFSDEPRWTVGSSSSTDELELVIPRYRSTIILFSTAVRLCYTHRKNVGQNTYLAQPERVFLKIQWWIKLV